MNTYYTKCGRTFEKSTKADVTGYHIGEDEAGAIIDAECAACPFVVDVKDGWPSQSHKRFECRAGSFPPNHENDYRGGADDKNTLSISSLDHEFCEAVISFARAHPELSANYSQDREDCRRVISVSCSQNKKGIAAKQELLNKFFPTTPTLEEEDMNNNIPLELPSDEELDELGAVLDENDFADFENEDDEIENETPPPTHRKPQCPFLGSVASEFIQCTAPVSCKNFMKLEFDTWQENLKWQDAYCFDRFLDCKDYRRFYEEQEADAATKSECRYCCNSSGYTGLPDSYDSQEYEFCQKHGEPRAKGDSCEWFDRHPDWPLYMPLIEAVETHATNNDDPDYDVIVMEPDAIEDAPISDKTPNHYLVPVESQAQELPEREPVMSVCPFCESQVPIQLDIAAEGQYDPEYYAMNNCTCADAEEWRRREKGRYERNKFEESVELQLSAVTGMDAEDECFRAIKALCLSVFDEDIDSFSVNLNYAAKLNVKSKNGMLEFERTEVHKQKRTA